MRRPFRWAFGVLLCLVALPLGCIQQLRIAEHQAEGYIKLFLDAPENYPGKVHYWKVEGLRCNGDNWRVDYMSQGGLAWPVEFTLECSLSSERYRVVVMGPKGDLAIERWD